MSGSDGGMSLSRQEAEFYHQNDIPALALGLFKQKKTVRVATNRPGVYKNLKTGKHDVKYRVWGFILYPPYFCARNVHDKSKSDNCMELFLDLYTAMTKI